jgi:CheY-like chemotaxis protein
MNAIIGMTDLVLDTKLDATQRNFLSMVQESGESLLAVINDILDFSKIEAGKLDIEPQVFDIRESFGDTMKTLGLKAHTKGLELAFRVDPAVPRYVVGDAGRLRQILVNLVGNSIKFTDRGEVVVEVARLPGATDKIVLEVRVRDTGIGIPEEKCKTIFNEFEQADTSTTRRFGGTGLGLAISSRLVTLMEGEIDVTSVVDQGSTFRFNVNLGLAPDDFEQQKNRGVVVVGGTRVLVVDDNETNLMILDEMLSNWGMVPTLADSGELALRELRDAQDRDEPFGLIVSDVNMPEMSGYDFVEKLRGDLDLTDTQVIILTSGGRQGDHSLSEQLGISERLMKPVKQSELFDAIVRALGVTAPEDAKTYDAQHEGLDLGQLRVLLVEDNVINQKLAIGVLTKYGHQVAVAGDGQEAIQTLEQEQFDVVLMDVQMPVMDGLEATRAIREKEVETGHHVPIIAMTAHAMKGDRERCIEAGMDEYVAKPIRIASLREKLAIVLGVADVEIEKTESEDAVESEDAPEQRSTDRPAADSQAAEDEDDFEFDCDHLPQSQSPSETRSSADSLLDGNDLPRSGGELTDDATVGEVASVAVYDAIDWNHARTTVGGDGRLLCELLSVYLGEAHNLLTEIRQAIDARDQRNLKRAAHTLKGASLSVGALRTSEIAERLENVEHVHDFSDAMDIFGQLEASMKTVIAAANEYLTSQT